MKTKTKIILLAVVVAGMVLTWAISGLVQCTDINDHINRALQQEVDEEMEARVQRIDGKLEKVGFWKFLFVPKMKQYQALKEENDRYILQQVQQLSDKIDGLEPCTSIASEEEYYALRQMIRNMEVDEKEPFGQRVRELTSNYEELEAYAEAFYDLVETYEHKCSSCGGSGRVSCGSCGGRGVKGVTWYEFGDWGETSYSNYDCPTCDGRGKKDCGICDNGTVLRFYNEPEIEEDIAQDLIEEEIVWDMNAVLLSFLYFEEDGSARHDYLMEHPEELTTISKEDLEGILSNQDIGLLEIDVTGGNTDMRFYRVTEYANGAGTMENPFTIVWEDGAAKVVQNPTATTMDIANENGVLKKTLSMSFQLRMAAPGYYFAYRYMAGGAFPAPMYLYILCDKNGTPVNPLV